MDTTTINGLHKCQPKNVPEQGETKNMVVVNMPVKGDKKAWIKIKNELPDRGGTPYRILNVVPLDWPPDQYGNVAMNLEIEASDAKINTSDHRSHAQKSQGQGEPPAFSKARDTMQQGETLEEQGAYHQESLENPPQSTTKRFSMLDERQRAIIRQHSQSMALEVLKLKVTLNELTVADLTPSKLGALADYFDQDVYKATE